MTPSIDTCEMIIIRKIVNGILENMDQVLEHSEYIDLEDWQINSPSNRISIHETLDNKGILIWMMGN